MSSLTDIKSVYANFYKTNYIWVISSPAMAANLALKYVTTHLDGKSIVLPRNASHIMINAAQDSSLDISVCDIVTYDFGLDPKKLNETSASIIYAKDSYGVASSYCVGSQGRFVVEDMLESPFTPHTGTGHIFYTSIPGKTDVAILMTRDASIAAFLDSEITKLGLNLSTEYAHIVYEQLERRYDILLGQISTAHTLLKLLPDSIRTANILCNYFSSIPLILSKDATSFITNSNTGNYLYKISAIPTMSNIIVIELLDASINTLAGIANRITNYLETP